MRIFNAVGRDRGHNICNSIRLFIFFLFAVWVPSFPPAFVYSFILYLLSFASLRRMPNVPSRHFSLCGYMPSPPPAPLPPPPSKREAGELKLVSSLKRFMDEMLI